MAKNNTSFKDYLLKLVDDETPESEKDDKKKKRKGKKRDADVKRGLLKYLLKANAGN